MPKLLQQTELRIEWSDVLNRIDKDKFGSEARSSGVHMSGIIRHCMGYDQRIDDPDEMPLCMALGLAWEQWAVGLFPSLIWQPGEESLDDIYGTPDGMNEIQIKGRWEIIVEEWKATYKSRQRHGQDILSATAWMWQISGLAKMLQVHYARLHVLWINGDYKPPSPVYVTYLIEFTQAELDRTWNNIFVTNRSNAKPEVH